MTAIPPEWQPFTGVPYDDETSNCWHLVRAIYRARYALELPDLGPLVDAVAVFAHVEREAQAWSRVPWGSERPGDVVVLWFMDPAHPSHIGVIVRRGHMVSCRAPRSLIEPIDDTFWKRRVHAIYRHPSTDPVAADGHARGLALPDPVRA